MLERIQGAAASCKSLLRLRRQDFIFLSKRKEQHIMSNFTRNYSDCEDLGTFTWKMDAGGKTLWIAVGQDNITSQCMASQAWSSFVAAPNRTYNGSSSENTSFWLVPSAMKPYLCSGGVDILAAESYSSYILAAQQQVAQSQPCFTIEMNSYNDLYAIYTATLVCLFGAFVVVKIGIGIVQGPSARCCGCQTSCLDADK